jgi:transcriptional regulator with XRE-family HTH domain
MTGKKLKKARKKLGLTQVEAAKCLGVSQTYFSLLEKGERRFTDELTKKAVRLFKLSPTVLPMNTELQHLGPTTNQRFVRELAALNYPGYTHVKPSNPTNPAQLLLKALSSDDLEGRLVEALPWLLFNFSDLQWKSLVDAVKLKDLQNRLGFLTSLARQLAEKSGNVKKYKVFKQREQELERSRLVKEDTLCRKNMTNAERRWLSQNRSPEAAHWNILSNLSAEHLKYVK